jgi:hypothetical protein
VSILNDLPLEHPLRNTPLHSLNTVYRWKHSQAWLPIGEKFGIAKKTFNELSVVWTDNDIFGVL